MIEGKSVLAIVPARGGSKGVYKKNIRNAAGKPLIAWTIEEAKKSKYIDRLVLSSDDDEIIKTAKSLGCEVPFKRPEILAQDDTPGIEPVIHMITNLDNKYDFILLLQPTSPLRLAADIDGCIEYFINRSAESCVSVCEVDKSPYWMYTLGVNDTMVPLLKSDLFFSRRQVTPKTYIPNGAIYISSYRFLVKNKNFFTDSTKAYVMPKERSLDVDSEFDLKMVSLLLENQIF